MSWQRIAALPRPLRFALGLSVGAILYATLSPSYVDDQLPPWWCVACGERGGADFILNVILFMPFGCALRLAGTRLKTALLTGMFLSIFIELTQAFIPGRDTTLGDVISNTTGAVLGFILLAVLIALARRTAPRGGPAVPVGAAALALGVVALTGLALQPSFPPSTWFGQWTADLDGGLGWYRGRILSASLGPLALPSRELDDQERVQTLLAAGAPLAVTAIAGPAPDRLAPLFSIYDDREREILMIAPRGHDLVIRIRTRGLAHGLDRPYLTLRDALRAVQPGDTLRLTLWREGGPHGPLCLTLDGKQDCALRFTAGAGWSILIFPQSLAPWVRALLNTLWVGGILLPAGFFTTDAKAVAGVGAVVMAGLLLVPEAVGLGVTPWEWLGAAAGIAAGIWGRRFLQRLPS